MMARYRPRFLLGVAFLWASLWMFIYIVYNCHCHIKELTPPTTTPQERVAIIVPYRDREIQLEIFTNYMATFLKRQGVEADIYIIDQAPKGLFNRAMLFNVGYNESMKIKPYTCFIFHDVDLIPENINNTYMCEERPCHMSSSVDSLGYQLNYPEMFGGVTSINHYYFNLCDGYPNIYWGWGGEDDEMFYRLHHRKVTLYRRPFEIGRYTMLTKTGHHTAATPNIDRQKLLNKDKMMKRKDGLSTLRYGVLGREIFPHYQRILVDIYAPRNFEELHQSDSYLTKLFGNITKYQPLSSEPAQSPLASPSPQQPPSP